MPGKRNMPIPPPTDCTKNGKCSKCGGCCASLLPVSPQELKAMKAEADRLGVHPEVPGVNHTTVYLRCPFLDTDTETCRIYDARPQVCRSFLCSHTHQENAADYQKATGAQSEDDVPAVVNIWSAYNLTGLKVDGIDVKYDECDYVMLGGSDGSETKVQVGRPVSVMTNVGDVYLNAMVLKVAQSFILVFDGVSSDIKTVFYGQIREIEAPGN